MLVCWRVSCLSASQIAVAFEINFQVLTYLGPPKHIQRIHWIASKTHRQPSNSGKWRSINLYNRDSLLKSCKVPGGVTFGKYPHPGIQNSSQSPRRDGSFAPKMGLWRLLLGPGYRFFLGTLRIQAPPDRTGFFGLQSYPWKSIFRCNPFRKGHTWILRGWRFGHGIIGTILVSTLQPLIWRHTQ